MAKRDWDVPRRDLLDIERTSQAEAVEAADNLADVLEAMLPGLRPDNAYLPQVRRALTAYRVARGQDTGEPSRPWTTEEILAREG